MSSPLVVYVDVDDTLVRTTGNKRIPVPSVVAHVRALAAEGAELYLWSSGGAEYARTSADELGITSCFRAFLPKPNVMIDDQEINTWRRFVAVHPAGCVESTIEDYRAKGGNT